MNLSKKQIGLYLAVLIVGALIGYLISTSAHQQISTSNNQTIKPAENQTWTCSMHPQIKKSEPGDCPICGMDLIPQESADDDLDPDAVRMSPTAMQLAQVQTAIVGKGNSEKSIRLNGKVHADERLLFTQSSHIPGRIEKLTVDFTGVFVSEGQVIANIYSPALTTAQEELFEARKIKETQPALFNAAKEKLKNWKLTDAQIDHILESDKIIEQFPILANASGYVTKKMVNLGDYVKEGQAIFEIAQLSRVWVLFDVYESDMNWIKKGASVTYSVQSIPGETFEGTISYIDPVIDPKTRVAKARIETNNSDLALKPGMFVSGTLEAETKSSDQSITVPKSAVMWTGKRSVVYVMQTSDQGVNFKMREVALGPELGERFVIESGIEPGEEIAVHGTFSIDAAAQLAGKSSMMNRADDTASRSADAPVSEDLQKGLKQLFSDYFDLKNHLVQDDFKKAIDSATRLQSSLTEMSSSLDHETIEKSDHEFWTQKSKSLKKGLERGEGVYDIEGLREEFIGISNTMIALAEYFDPISSTVYLQHCPMADSNKGADWLSKEKEIRNPYFGEAMLTCGEVTRTLE